MNERMLNEAQKRANDLRDKFGYSLYSAVDVFGMVESAALSANITLLQYPLESENISGMCIEDKESRVIVVNSRQPLGRLHFTIAHEFCHLYYHRDRTPEVCYLFEEKSEIEKEADLFATHFLMPDMAMNWYIRQHFNKDPFNPQTRLDLKEAIEIQSYYGFSRKAILWRLYNSGLITGPDMDAYKKEPMRTAELYMMRTDLYRSAEEKCVKGEYLRLLKKIETTGSFSEKKLKEFYEEVFENYIPDESSYEDFEGKKYD